jgi:integrase
MARRLTGQVLVREGPRGRVFALRFRAYGKREYFTLGSAEEGWTRAKAEEELENVLADVRRGIWKPPERESVAVPRKEPTFHEFASEWYASKENQGLATRTLEDYRWALTHHLLPWFKDYRLNEITKREVDRFRDAKAAEGVLSHRIINKVLTRLAQVLGDAAEYDLIPSNPASGKRRRLKVRSVDKSWVKPQQLMALLAGSEDLLHGRGRPLVATLAATGLRIEEVLSLRWADIDVARGTLVVRESKTDAGRRVVRLRPALRDELALYRDKAKHSQAEDLVFPTETGRPDNRNNVRRRLLVKAAEKADKRLVKLGIEPIGKISPHSLRRTNATLRSLVGEPAKRAAKEMGHVSSRFTFDCYEQAADMREWLQGQELAEFDSAIEWAEWAQMGTNGTPPEESFAPEETEVPA